MMFLFNFLQLDEKQKAKLQEWLDSLPKEELEETACMEGPEYTMKGFDSGIGPCFWVERRIGNVIWRCHLAYDDDGNLN